MKKDWMMSCGFLFFLALVSAQLAAHLYQRAAARMLREIQPEQAQFRCMQLGERMPEELAALRKETGMPVGELLTVLLPFESCRYFDTHGFEAADFIRWKEILLKYERRGFEQISAFYGAIWDDVVCLPVAGPGVRYENSWMFERTYGGLRGHEGTDLFPPQNIPGHYRIVSMTDGVVERVGWLPKGGYRIGIRSPSGGYFYYAHLNSYSRNFQPGEAVGAGEVLGLMGDTGYGAEGTHGKFAVHLHLGIYIRTGQSEELSVNPYWVLRYLAARNFNS